MRRSPVSGPERAMPSRSVLLSLALVVFLSLGRPTPAADPAFNGRPLPAWLAMLKDDPLPRKRRAAVVALGQIAADFPDSRTAVLPAVARALRNDSNPGVRLQAATVLGQQPTDRGELFLLDTVEALRIEKDSEVRREVAVALGRLGRYALPAVGPLADVLKDPAPAARAAAAEALGRIGPDASPAGATLIGLTKDADRGVRAAAVFALGRVDPDDRDGAATAVVGVLADERTADARLAARAAAASGAAAAGRDTGLASAAVVSLGLLGSRSADAVRAVAVRLADPDADVRQLAALTLRKFGPAAQAAIPELTAAFRDDPAKQVRTYALHALSAAHAGQPGTFVPLVVGRLKSDPDFEVRVAIAEEIGALGPAGKDALPALREAQRDPQLKVREAATAAVRQVRRPAEKAKP
jgi:HEAT repeat protein